MELLPKCLEEEKNQEQIQLKLSTIFKMKINECNLAQIASILKRSDDSKDDK